MLTAASGRSGACGQSPHLHTHMPDVHVRPVWGPGGPWHPDAHPQQAARGESLVTSEPSFCALLSPVTVCRRPPHPVCAGSPHVRPRTISDSSVGGRRHGEPTTGAREGEERHALLGRVTGVHI